MVVKPWNLSNSITQWFSNFFCRGPLRRFLLIFVHLAEPPAPTNPVKKKLSALSAVVRPLACRTKVPGFKSRQTEPLLPTLQ